MLVSESENPYLLHEKKGGWRMMMLGVHQPMRSLHGRIISVPMKTMLLAITSSYVTFFFSKIPTSSFD